MAVNSFTIEITPYLFVNHAVLVPSHPTPKIPLLPTMRCNGVDPHSLRHRRRLLQPPHPPSNLRRQLLPNRQLQHVRIEEDGPCIAQHSTARTSTHTAPCSAGEARCSSRGSPACVTRDGAAPGPFPPADFSPWSRSPSSSLLCGCGPPSAGRGRRAAVSHRLPRTSRASCRLPPAPGHRRPGEPKSKPNHFIPVIQLY
jgi:hypothetical protein